jgi:hypothetical protein
MQKYTINAQNIAPTVYMWKVTQIVQYLPCVSQGAREVPIPYRGTREATWDIDLKGLSHQIFKAFLSPTILN